MSGIICKSVMGNCQNPYDSYGEICVGCNCCGRFGEDTMWSAQYELAIRRLSELIEHLTSEHFQSNLQQGNICSSISYWSEKLKEILTHLDFDKEKGADNEQSEGEWIVEEHPLVHDKKISCSCCGYSERRGPAWNISWGFHSFCPNCGAKMKGGAE